MEAARTSERVQRRRAQNRRLLLEAAEELLSEHGAAAVGIEAIAERADVSVGTVYTHFGSKDGLLLALADRILERAEQSMSAAYDAHRSPLAQVAEAGTRYAEFLLAQPLLVASMAPNGPRPNKAEHTIVAAASRRVEAMHAELERRIAAGIRAGEIKQLDPRSLARLLFGAWNGIVALTLESAMGALTINDARACLELAREIVVDGISTPRRPANTDEPSADLI